MEFDELDELLSQLKPAGPKVYKIGDSGIEFTRLREIAQAIKSGKVVIFPTDTVYGIGANAYDSKAVNKVYKIKGQPKDKPMSLHIPNLHMLVSVVEEMPPLAEELMEKFWPGPLTIIFKAKKDIPSVVRAGKAKVGIRYPDCRILQLILEEADVPLAGTIASVANRLATTAEADSVKKLSEKVDLVIDAGPTRIGIESTVIDVTQEPIVVYKEGAIKASDIRKVLSGKEIVVIEQPRWRYLKSPVYIVQGEGRRERIIALFEEFYRTRKVGLIVEEGWLGFPESIPHVVEELSPDLPPSLYSILRKMLERQIDILVVEDVSHLTWGGGFMERLKKLIPEYKIIET